MSPAISPGLSDKGFVLRPETEADGPFLRRLYISTRWEELASVGNWRDAEKIAFLDSQSDAQRSYYLVHYASAAFDVLEAQGVPAGRLYLDRQADTLLIVDIALLPQWCGRVIGIALLEPMFAEVRLSGKGVTISVEKLTRRSGFTCGGFREYAEDDVYRFMHWSPQGNAPAAISRTRPGRR